MRNLRYFTETKVDELWATVGDRLDWYYGAESGAKLNVVGTEFRTTTIKADEFLDRLQRGGKHPDRDDASNALCAYQTLPMLTFSQASDERFWVYVSHVECHEYIRDRWLRKRKRSNRDAINDVRNHFFAKGSRGVFRDNGISRLWWLGRVAHDVDPDHPERFLEIVLHRKDIRSALLERPFISTNRQILRGIYDIMLSHWDHGQKGHREGNHARRRKDLFHRDVFRRWMIALNRRGGVVLLDSLCKEALYEVLGREAEQSLGAVRK